LSDSERKHPVVSHFKERGSVIAYAKT
jgi:hypothetical protein